MCVFIILQVKIDTTAPDFIKWDDINGIDGVKQEITEIIDYLQVMMMTS